MVLIIGGQDIIEVAADVAWIQFIIPTSTWSAFPIGSNWGLILIRERQNLSEAPIDSNTGI